MQRIAFLQLLGVCFAFLVPVFIGKEFYFLSLACVLFSSYLVMASEQLATKFKALPVRM